MANVSVRGAFRATVLIEVTEQEAGALEALFSYNAQGFLDTFYEKMGKHYLGRYEEGFRLLHKSRGEFANALRRIKDAREVFEGSKTAEPLKNNPVTQCSVVLERDGNKIACLLNQDHDGPHRTHTGEEFVNDFDGRTYSLVKG